jgi:RND family efflux transporter MFP subunit
MERAGILALLGIEAAPTEAAEASDRSGRASGPKQVIVAPVEARVQADDVTAIGDGRAQHSVTVRSEAVGKITELALQAGNRVEAGAVIVRLEDEAETIALERARITLDNAISDAERVGRLESTGAVTEVRAREAELALRTAELNLRQAQLDLERRRIIAPISGWVGIIDVEVGDRIAAQESLVSITDRSNILIDFRIPERVIGNTMIGMPVRIMPLGLRNLELQGEISAIDTVVDRASRTLRVQARVDNGDDLLRVGMAFQVSLSFPGETLLSVDPLALQWSSDGAFVWAVRGDKVERVNVTIRQRNSDQVLVEGDLEPGEPIVTEGVQELRPGSEVVISGNTEARSASLPGTKS